MKILQFILNKGMGGVEQCAVDYVKSLSCLGHNVYTIIPKEGAGYEKLLEKTNSKILKINTDNKISIFFSLRQITKEIRPDVFISHSGRGSLLMKLAFLFGKKFVSIGIDHGSNPKKYLKYNKADYSFCVNTDQAKKTNELSKRLGKKLKAYYVPNMIDLHNTKFKSKKWRKPVRIGILSRIDFTNKGFFAILEAMSILQKKGIDLEFVVGGAGDVRQLKKKASELGLEKELIYKGWVKNKKKFFDSIDIFCMPSLIESFGISYLEAIKYSTPCIATNTHGGNDIFINEKDGIIISKDNKDKMPELLADALEKLINNKKFTKKLSENAFYKLKKAFSIEANSKRINEIFKEIT